MTPGKFIFRIFLFVGVPLFAAIFTYIFLTSSFVEPANELRTEKELVEVVPGAFKPIAKNLEEKGFVKHWWSLTLLAKFMRKDTKIQPGEYELSPSMTPKEIVLKLVSGDVFKRKVVVREGVSVWSIGALVEQAGLMKSLDFEAALTDRELLKAAGLGADSFEGYLFPETYFFSRPITAKDIIWRMLEEGEKHWPKTFSDRAGELSLTKHQILTLASIIEKESGKSDEQPTISSVFHNRLNQGMRLQSDPTVIYGIKDFNGNLRKEDLTTPTPYNTYTNFGLPPGPIGNPGDTAIRAALYPEQTTFLFFVANGQGGHVFSSTLQEHNEAVARYQLGIGRKREAAPTPTPQPKDNLVPVF